MFESAELGHKIDKETFEKEAPALREALLAAQLALVQQAKFPVLILIGGVDAAGKGETVNLLNEWLDPRHIQTHAMGEPSDEERERPPLWRYWRALPPRGKIGIFVGSWYSAPILDRVYDRTKNADLDQSMEKVVRFERMLVDEGALILKFWLHLSRKKQKERFRTLEKDPSTRWRVSKTDWRHYEMYDQFRTVTERALRQSSTAEAPWLVVEGADAEYRALAVGKALLEALQKRLEAGEARRGVAPVLPLAPAVDKRHILRSLELSRSLDKKQYAKELEKHQGRLSLLLREKRFRKRSLVAVFEGSDAAGKGGAIRRVTAALDARQYRVVPVAAPTEEERAQPYLWRFWRHIPRRGQLAVFDRSWYGRVLVERVEGFCPAADWMRAYGEINDFEEELTEHGVIVAKFWLQISKEEQLRRFKQRETVGFKRHKITAEDWRNRKKWGDYERAVCDLVDKTSTEIAPWTLVEANSKLHARIKVLRTLCDRVEAAL